MGEPLISAVFDLDITARTSIVHRDDTRNSSSIQSLFRRVILALGDLVALDTELHILVVQRALVLTPRVGTFPLLVEFLIKLFLRCGDF